MLSICLLACAVFPGDPGPSAEPAIAELPRGCLVVDGGGKASPIVRRKTLAISGGPKARVLIVPQASLSSRSGELSAALWRDLGAEDVAVLDLADPPAALAAIGRADLIWIGGGEQERLMTRLEGTGVPEAIRLRYREGATVGGSSAGAAVMSLVMIARSEQDFPRPRSNVPVLGEGLGLWPEVIVDQHFLKRHRTDRLSRAVAEHPDLIGVGIDESTAVIVRGGRIEVVGESRVTVIDSRVSGSRKASGDGGGDGPPGGESRSVPRISSLEPGVTFDLLRGMISDPIAETR